MPKEIMIGVSVKTTSLWCIHVFQCCLPQIGVSFFGRPVSVFVRRKQHVHDTLLHKINDGNFEADSYYSAC